jgi:hypothetical protein
MPLTRLLAFLFLVFSLCAASSLAQTPNEDLSLIHFKGAASMNAAENSAIDQSPSAPQIKPDSLFDASGPRHISNIPPLADVACLAIRRYRMVRDDAHSDAVHFGGYTTCVPAARFRMYTTVEREGLGESIVEPAR